MDSNITLKIRAQDAAGELPANPVAAPVAAHRGMYQFPLIEIARLVAQLAAQRDGMTVQQLQTAPCPLDPASPLVLAARGACLERGYQADGSPPRGFAHGDRREGQPETITLTGHQLRTALDLLNPDGPADRDQLDDWLTFGVRMHRGDDGKVSTGLCCWNDDTDGVLPLDGEYDGGDWIPIERMRPGKDQGVWVAILTRYTNGPARYSVSPAVFAHGQFRDAHSDHNLQWPTHWMRRDRPAPPLLPAE